jgi:hypothetical protein
MSAAIIIGLTLLLAAGLALLLLGLRGRRINDHPICRGCGFDLVGVLPAGSTCPECGAGIKSSRWVRIGARKKRVTWMLAGLVLTLGAAVPLGTGVFALASGASIVRHKPLGLLLWEARRGSDETRGIIGAELERRMIAGSLNSEQAGLAAELALEIQADLDRTWQPVWARVFEQARLANATTPSQVEQFGVQSIVPGLLVRPVVRAGDPLPFEIVTKEYRGVEPVAQSASYMAQITDMSLAGKALALERPKSIGDSRMTFSLHAPRANRRMSRPSTTIASVGPDTATGRHPFVVTLKVDQSRWPVPGQPQPSTANDRTLTLISEVDVRAKETLNDTSIDLSSDMMRELTDFVKTAGIAQYEMGSEGYWAPTINFQSPPGDDVAGSFQSADAPAIHADIIVVQADGTERAIGELRNELIVQTDTTRALAQWSFTSGTTIHPIPLSGSIVTLRLKFDPEKARRFIRVSSPVRGELTISDVPMYFQTIHGVRANTLEEFRRLNAKPDGQ